jgi:hypothetical protein
MFMLLSVVSVPHAEAHPRLGDDEWMERFRVFVKHFNAFVDSLNDGKFDMTTWRQMGEAWRLLAAS